MQLVRLDQVFRLATGAVELLVQPARRAVEVGDDEAAVGALSRGFDPGDDLLAYLADGQLSVEVREARAGARGAA